MVQATPEQALGSLPPTSSLPSTPLTASQAWQMPVFDVSQLPAGEAQLSLDVAQPRQDEVRTGEVWNVPLGSQPESNLVSRVVDNPATWSGVATGIDSNVASSTPKTSPDCPRGYVRGEVASIWGVKLDAVRMDGAIEAIEQMVVEGQPRYVITANLNYAMLLSSDPTLDQVTDDASLVLADGQPFVWRSRIGDSVVLPERVAGSELIYRLAERAALRGWRIYFLGAEPGVAQRCADALAKRYPGLQIAGVQSPPYRQLSEEESLQQSKSIIESNADILLVAFGQPKGEKWIHSHYRKLGIPVSIQLGASFDFVAGTARRAPAVLQQLGLEWAYRMTSDPGRLVPRYFNNACFLLKSLIRDWCEFVTWRFEK